MAAMSDYLEKAVLDHVLNNVALTSPTNVYVALFDANCSLAKLETGTDLTDEITGGSYARVVGPFGAATLGAGTSANDQLIEFTQASADWDTGGGIVTYVAIMDGDVEEAGNVLYYGALSQAKTVNSGDTFKFSIGDLIVSMD